MRIGTFGTCAVTKISGPAVGSGTGVGEVNGTRLEIVTGSTSNSSGLVGETGFSVSGFNRGDCVVSSSGMGFDLHLGSIGFLHSTSILSLSVKKIFIENRNIRSEFYHFRLYLIQGRN